MLLPSMHSGSTGRSATFCAVANILECLKAEGAVDIFRVIREIRMRQPHAVDREVGSNDEQLTNAHTHTHTHTYTHTCTLTH